MEISELSVVGVIREADNTVPCVFCKTPEIDEVNLGPIYTYEDVVCHYYCLLFSAALSQTGSDHQGILGFMPPEIKKEVKRASRLKCTICRKNGASIGCCKSNCHRTFHFPCGLKNGNNFQFIKDYQVFCKKHSALQDVTPGPEVKYPDLLCPICLSPVSKLEDPIMTNCCKPSVYHKTCLKQMALNAGYFFKCPLCNAGQEFVEAMREQGIFVPEQDASWEREPNAFQELYEQYQRCDAEVCECPKGREYAASKGGFLLARCRLCGATGTHRQCGQLKTIAKWACKDCLEAEEKAELKKKLQVKIIKPKVSQCATKKKKTASFKSVRRVFSHQDDDERIDMSKIKISPACFAYFPYAEKHMKVFQRKQKQILPDWRGLKVQCNLVNWIGNAFEKSAQGAFSQPVELKIKSLALPKMTHDLKAEPPLLRKPVKSTTASKPRRRFKLSKWQRGVVKRKKQILIAKSALAGDGTSNPVKQEPTPSTSQQAASDLTLTQTANEEKQKTPSPPPSSFFKVPNPLKKTLVVKKTTSSPCASDLIVEYIVEISSNEAESACKDVDYNALRPLQPYLGDEFMLVDYSLLQKFDSSAEVEQQDILVTDILVGDNIGFKQNESHADIDETPTIIKKEESCASTTHPSTENQAEEVCGIIEALFTNEGAENEILEDEETENIICAKDACSSYHDEHSYSIRLDEFPLVVDFKDQEAISDALRATKTDNYDTEMTNEQQKIVANGSLVQVKSEKLDAELNDIEEMESVNNMNTSSSAQETVNEVYTQPTQPAIKQEMNID